MNRWLVSPKFDLSIFAGPAILALLLVGLESQIAPSGETPVGVWVIAILMVDVAHVWSTIFRTYLDRAELRRRVTLYTAAPAAAYASGVALHSISPMTFWTALAYLAVFHFVRQQYGWIALYNRKAHVDRFDRWLDATAIYAATVFPIIWWHAHLPRKFEWFIAGDFVVGLSPHIVKFGWPIYVAALGIFFARQVQRAVTGRGWMWGKITVVATTAACWGVGIIATNTDWAFTMTNVLIHGIPYMAVVWWYGRRAEHARESLLARVFRPGGWVLFYGLVIALAYVEELGWDRLIWHEHGGVFFGPEIEVGLTAQAFIVPLLALPQATHYVLDAWIWKTAKSSNPDLSGALNLSRPTGT